MELFLEILKYTLPSIIVIIAVLLVLKKMLKNEDRKRTFELSKQNSNLFTPVRLRAYERIVLLLERTKPASLLMRQNLQQKNCLQLQTELHHQIREEFEHNIAQQIYISTEAWTLICNARESLLKLVNLSASQFPSEEQAIKMAEFMIKVYEESQQTPTETALLFLRNEIKRNF